MDTQPGRADFVSYPDGRVEDTRPRPPVAPTRRKAGFFEMTPERRKLLAAAGTAFVLVGGHVIRKYNQGVAAREAMERKAAAEDRRPGR